jgi:hypothetical protein
MRSSTEPLEQFRALMEADLALQQRLAEPDDPAAFIALVVDSARDRGLSLAPEQVASAIAASRQVSAAEVGYGVARSPPKGWLPMRCQWHDGQLHLEWSYLGSRRLREPFFEDTAARCLAKPFNRLFRYSTPIEALPRWLGQHPGLPPTGFIFHMSRCGSTLLSQMLAVIADNIVVSEASPIDAVVQARRIRPDMSEEQHAAWLRWMIGVLGQPRSGAERHFFVKLDSWHILALPLFRQAFPTVPWIFLYRDPVEVLASQLGRRGMHMVPGFVGRDLLGLDASVAALPAEAYCAEVLGRICDGALKQYAPGAALLVNYRQLPAAVWSEVLPHFGIRCSERDHAAMADTARYDAKNPEQPFIGESAARQASATDRIRFAARQLGERHARLEALRAGRLISQHGGS